MSPLRKVVAGAADKYQRIFGSKPLDQAGRELGRTLYKNFGAFDAKKKPTEKTAPPVFPNVGVAAWYRQQLQRLLAHMTSELFPLLDEAYANSESRIGFAQDATRSDLLKKALEKWGGLWTGNLNRLSDELAAKFADKSFTATQASLKASFKQAGLTVKFQPTRGSVEAYKAVVAENIGLIKSIPQQYAKDVESQVWAAVMKGGDLKTLSDGIRKKYGVAQRRAELIATDQNAKAKAVLENVRRMELGIVEAIWMHSHAGKEPRPSHVAMNGKRYKLKKGMYDKDEGKYIWPGELIRCRCSSRPVIPGFE
jgi:SPP1 gp7 family putative phage head morphogenesis protein